MEPRRDDDGATLNSPGKLSTERTENFASPAGPCWTSLACIELPAASERMGAVRRLDGEEGCLCIEQDRGTSSLYQLPRPRSSSRHGAGGAGHYREIPRDDRRTTAGRLTASTSTSGQRHCDRTRIVPALIRAAEPIADRQFEIEFFGPGVEAFSFTFG